MLEVPLVVSLVLFYVLLLVAGLLLNTLLLKVLFSSRTDRRKISNWYLVVFLAVSVVACICLGAYHLVCLVAQLPQAGPNKYIIECKTAIFFVYSLSVLRVLSLVLLSLDRFWAVRWPYHYSMYSRKNVFIFSTCFIIIQSSTTVFPATVIPGLVTYQKVVGNACLFDWSRASISFIVPVISLDFILPSLILLFTNVFVFILARHHHIKTEKLRKRQNIESNGRGLGLVKTLVKTVELMEVGQGTDLPHSETSVSSNVVADCLTQPSPSECTCASVSLESMKEVSHTKLDIHIQKEPRAEEGATHQSEHIVVENSLSENYSPEEIISNAPQLNEVTKSLELEENIGNAVGKTATSNTCFSVVDNQNHSNFRDIGRVHMMNDQDQFSNLTKEKRLKVLSLPNGRFSNHDLALDIARWNSILSTLLLVFLFLLTWLPFIISRLIETFTSHVLSIEVVTITAALNNSDVVINPLIILFTRKSLRKQFKVHFRSLFFICMRNRST